MFDTQSNLSPRHRRELWELSTCILVTHLPELQGWWYPVLSLFHGMAFFISFFMSVPCGATCLFAPPVFNVKIGRLGTPSRSKARLVRYCWCGKGMGVSKTFAAQLPTWCALTAAMQVCDAFIFHIWQQLEPFPFHVGHSHWHCTAIWSQPASFGQLQHRLENPDRCHCALWGNSGDQSPPNFSCGTRESIAHPCSFS